MNMVPGQLIQPPPGAAAELGFAERVNGLAQPLAEQGHFFAGGGLIRIGPRCHALHQLLFAPRVLQLQRSG